MATYLITGITGTLGKIVSTRLLDEGHTIVGLSRDEFKQQNMPKHPNLFLYIGDVTDPMSFLALPFDFDAIFHFAALKHVDICGINPWQAVRTNIIGTQNVCDFQRDAGIPKIVFTSTDKAFAPINQYGKTKSVAENLVAVNPVNAICRYGNVFGSRGSVIQKFLDSLNADCTVNVTDPTMTRYFISPNDAATFVIGCLDKTGIQIPNMKSTDLKTLAAACATYLGITRFAINETGNRGAEKIHESLDENHDSYLSPKFSVNELIDLIKGGY